MHFLKTVSIVGLFALAGQAGAWAQGESATGPTTAPANRVVGVFGAEARLGSLVEELRLVATDLVADRGKRLLLGLLSEVEIQRLEIARVHHFVEPVATELWQRTDPVSFPDFARSFAGGELDAEIAAMYGTAEEVSGGSDFISGFPCYRTVEKTYADLSALASANPTLATWIDIGDSWENEQGSGGYEVWAIRITNSASLQTKAPFVIIATTHAREYTTAETATRFAEMLVNGYGSDPEITAILDTTEIHIVPIHNPDGRKRAEVAVTSNWRKNTNSVDASCGTSSGIDLNRNSEQFFGGVPGSSGSVCSETYRGPRHSSEPETLAINDLMASVFEDQRGPAMSDAAPPDTTGAFISIHSFSELILYPWEAVSTDSPNHGGLRSFGRRIGSYLPNYSVCQDCLGVAAGTNVDLAYGEYGVAAYTYELGTFFQQACSTFENSIFPEVSQSLLFAAKGSRRPYQEPKGPAVIDLMIDDTPVDEGTLIAVTGTADDTQISFGPGGDATPEPQENVTAAYYSIDDPPWTVGLLPALQPADGAFGDELVEGFTGAIDTTGLSPGKHLVYVVAEDASGQRGVATAAFINVADMPLFADGFETGDTTQWSSTSP